METLGTILPEAKPRLEIFEDVTRSLKISGELCDVPLVAIESDNRWITKKKSILTHSFDDSPLQPSEAIKRKDPPTVGGREIASKRMKRLGMLPMRRIQTRPQ